jgi:hypothetical protein
MRLKTTIALLTCAFALSATSALATQPEGAPPYGKGQGNGPTYTPGNPTPGPKAGLPEKAKAYGRYCQGESKKHVKGEKGTAFSRCVTAMARAANNDNLSPGQACKGTSRKHVKGEKGTPFSRCVKAAAQLRKEQAEGQV